MREVVVLVSCRFGGTGAEDADSGLLPFSLLVSWDAGVSGTGGLSGSSLVGCLGVA